jgi:hypothetical protein
MTRGTTLLWKIWWTLLTGFIGFAGSAMLDDLLKATLADQLIIAIVLGGVTLLAQYLVDLERRFVESERIQAKATRDMQRVIRRGIESADEANRLLAELEQSTVRRGLLKQVIHRSENLTQAAPPLVQALATSETQRLAKTLQSLVDGQELFYDGEDREFLLALTDCASMSMLAVSWATIEADGVGFEGELWLSDLGARYLDLQRQALRRGVVIRRIFLLDAPTHETDPALMHIFATQRSAGIEVKLADGRDPGQDGLSYVIFDEQICYNTMPMRRAAPGAPYRVTTRMELNEERVRHRIGHFDGLWKNARHPSHLHVAGDASSQASSGQALGPA